MQVKCKWPNVWTSKGKLLAGETSDDLPDDEAKELMKLGAVEGKRGRKKADEVSPDEK